MLTSWPSVPSECWISLLEGLPPVWGPGGEGGCQMKRTAEGPHSPQYPGNQSPPPRRTNRKFVADL